MTVKKLIEDIEKLLREEDIVEDELQDEVAVEVEPTFHDTMSLADTLDAKTKIARALEALQGATEEFKNASAEKLDLLQDSALLQAIEGLDEALKAIENALASGSNILGDSELNDAFKTELPAEKDEIEVIADEEETEEDDEEENIEYDFDVEAGFDLLHPIDEQ